MTKAMRAANRMNGGCNVSSGDEVDVGEETRDHDLDEYRKKKKQTSIVYLDIVDYYEQWNRMV